MNYVLAIAMLTIPGAAQAGLCAARDLPAGQRLAAADVAEGPCTGDLASIEAVTGQTLTRAVQRGVGLRRSLLAAPMAVRRGERVVFSEGGPGFEVEGTGIALADAGVGEMVGVDCGDRKRPRRVLMSGAGRGEIVD